MINDKIVINFLILFVLIIIRITRSVDEGSFGATTKKQYPPEHNLSPYNPSDIQTNLLNNKPLSHPLKQTVFFKYLFLIFHFLLLYFKSVNIVPHIS